MSARLSNDSSLTDTKIENDVKNNNGLIRYHSHFIRHNLHCLSLHSICTGIPLYPESSKYVNLASFLKHESISGIPVLPSYHPMPGVITIF